MAHRTRKPRGFTPEALRWQKYALVLALSLVLAIPAVAAANGEVGTSAPDFSLMDINDDTHTMSGHLGEVVVLFFMGWG